MTTKQLLAQHDRESRALAAHLKRHGFLDTNQPDYLTYRRLCAKAIRTPEQHTPKRRTA